MVGDESIRHRFVFHGKAGEFFLICLVNFLLTVITLGIYLPWAFVKTRRYIYENMELNGARFQYHATGGAIFSSQCILGLFFVVASIVCGMIHPGLNLIPLLVFIFLMPLMVVKGLRYQAMMTSLNNVRFGFQCGPWQAMWVLLGLPILMLLAGIAVVCVFNMILGTPSDMTGIIIHLVVVVLVVLLTLGVANGFIYSKWMQLLGNNACFGIHSFSLVISIKRCIMAYTLSMLILLPFIIVIGKIIAPIYVNIILAMALGGLDDASQAELLLQHQNEIIVSYLLYFGGVILATTFIKTSLRNIFINGLQLGNGLRFHSSLTFIDMLMQILVLTLVSSLTLGLAYPWARIRFVRYQANNTAVIGDLDALELVDSDEPVDKGFFAFLCRCIVPAVPFI